MKAIGGLEKVSLLRWCRSPCALTIRNGPESYPDCSMLEVNPLADVPRANLLRVCKRLQPGCKPTDAEDSTDDGNGNYAFVKIRHLSGPLYGATVGSRTSHSNVRNSSWPGRTASLQSVPHPGTSHGRCGCSGGAIIGSSRAGTAIAIDVSSSLLLGGWTMDHFLKSVAPLAFRKIVITAIHLGELV